MNFETAIEFVLQKEGGYVNHPSDPGGETNFGISKRAHPGEDIKGMTRERAIEIYRRQYWEPIKGDDLPPYLRLIALDCAVLQGVGFASQCLQMIARVPIDGIVGPQTITALWVIEPVKAQNDFMQLRMKRFKMKFETWKVFGAGWTNRMNDLVAFQGNFNRSMKV